ncbi:phytanoyl-CoA dioxygenase family protein [Luteolibacter sp. Populi]|uniref:phytanoyl-CoA dioxygenase family protein n=1 Tax=Luteolibacter sp. Populi TaxID=3230487 RepID=UPI003467B767
MVSTGRLQAEGWAVVETGLVPDLLHELRGTAFSDGAAGTRCLLDLPAVLAAARQLKSELIGTNILPSSSVAIQAIAFDKTPGKNWKVAWHQDLMFPFARPVEAPGFELATKKDGVDFARPPVAVLQDLLAIRLHLDPCDEPNGPLRVSPGSHLRGVIPSAGCAALAKEFGEINCLAREGEALLMKPLLLHASSPAISPGHRRVIHYVFHTGDLMDEEWHRRV